MLKTLSEKQATLSLGIEIFPNTELKPHAYAGVEFTGTAKMVDENGIVIFEHYYDREKVTPVQSAYHNYHPLVNAVKHLISDQFYMLLKTGKKNKKLLEKPNTQIVCIPERMIVMA